MNFAKMAEESKAINERNDCAVKALALCAGIPYDQAHTLLRRNGRRWRKSTKWHVFWPAFESLGLKREQFTTRHKTIVAFGRRPPHGTYLIATRGHLACCRDGKVEDWTEGRRHRIQRVWRVTKVGDPVELTPEPCEPTPRTLVIKLRTKGEPSSKMKIYTMWKVSPDLTLQFANALAQEHHVQFSTVKGWIGEWSRGKNFPTR